MNIDNAVVAAGTRRDSDSGTRLDIATEEPAALPGPAAPRALPTPVSRVHADREQHTLSHLPCQLWCPACVVGRGRDDPHRRRAHKDLDILPVIAFGHTFGRDDTGAPS